MYITRADGNKGFTPEHGDIVVHVGLPASLLEPTSAPPSSFSPSPVHKSTAKSCTVSHTRVKRDMVTSESVCVGKGGGGHVSESHYLCFITNEGGGTCE